MIAYNAAAVGSLWPETRPDKPYRYQSDQIEGTFRLIRLRLVRSPDSWIDGFIFFRRWIELCRVDLGWSRSRSGMGLDGTWSWWEVLRHVSLHILEKPPGPSRTTELAYYSHHGPIPVNISIRSSSSTYNRFPLLCTDQLCFTKFQKFELITQYSLLEKKTLLD